MMKLKLHQISSNVLYKRYFVWIVLKIMWKSKIKKKILYWKKIEKYYIPQMSCIVYSLNKYLNFVIIANAFVRMIDNYWFRWHK